jgi:uncharacterized protein YprB with RNaseH-like and TPR domain
MDLKRRLARFEELTRRPEPPPSPKVATAAEAPAPGSPASLRALGVVRRDTPAGPAFHRDALASAGPSPELAADLDGILRAPGAARNPGEILFLDTETTGLAGGTGSLAFLVGLAWWEAEGLRVRQYFLPGPGREAPILSELERLATRFRAIVTYNGATFDLPLLRTRALLARRADPLAKLASWDLLTAARRLWGRRLPDVRQPTVEAAVCGLPRAKADIPGALIPQAYFRYLETGATGELARVLQHNHWDMEGMARILTTVAATAAALDPEAAEPGLAGGPGHALLAPPWQDAWARGRIWEYRRDARRAAVWLERAVAGSGLLLPEPPTGPDAPPERFLADAVRILKRRRRWQLVRDVVERGLALHGERPWLRREAAIVYEHRLGRLDRALVHAEALGEEARLLRLRRKIAGLQTAGSRPAAREPAERGLAGDRIGSGEFGGGESGDESGGRKCCPPGGSAL